MLPAGAVVVLVGVGLAIFGTYQYSRSDAAVVQRCSSVPKRPFYLNKYANADILPARVRGRRGFKVGNVTHGNYSAWASRVRFARPTVRPAQSYAFAAYVVGPRKQYQAVRGYLEWHLANGQIISNTQGDLFVVGGAQGLQRVLVSGTAPAQARYALPKIAVTGDPPSGSAVYVASARFGSATTILSTPPLCPRFVPAPPQLRVKGSATISQARKHNPFGPWLHERATKSEPCPIPHTEAQCPFYDKRDIPVVRYNGALGVRYNPQTIAENGLNFYSSYLYTHDKKQLKQAIRDARWLVRHQTRNGRWMYGFKLPAYETALRWPSAMAQGGAMALLVRVWHLTGNDRYLVAAKRALRPFRVPVLEGGVLDYWRGRYPFYEEASSTEFPSFILNGYVYALAGLYDVAWAAPRSVAGKLYVRGYRSLVKMLPLYDYGPGMSVYDLEHFTDGRIKAPAGHYNDVHVRLLRVVDSYTKSRVLRHYIQRWSGS